MNYKKYLIIVILCFVLFNCNDKVYAYVNDHSNTKDIYDSVDAFIKNQKKHDGVFTDKYGTFYSVKTKAYVSELGLKPNEVKVTLTKNFSFKDYEFSSILNNGISALSSTTWDDSLGVKATIDAVFEYSKSLCPSSKKIKCQYVKITKVTGRWDVIDTSIKLSNRSVSANMTGTIMKANGGPDFKLQKRSWTTSKNTFTFKPSPQFVKVSIDHAGTISGVSSKATLRRGSSVWNLNLYYNY